jgi:hypothetical protein
MQFMVTSDFASALSWFKRVFYFGARLMITTLMSCIMAIYWPKIKKKPPNSGMMPLTNNVVAGHKAVHRRSHRLPHTRCAKSPPSFVNDIIPPGRGFILRAEPSSGA